jgi:predicted dehydrogenase
LAKPQAQAVSLLDKAISVAALRAGKVFMVHQNRRWDADYLTVRKILEAGSLGRVCHMESRVRGSRGIPGDWRRLARHGGGIRELIPGNLK